MTHSRSSKLAFACGSVSLSVEGDPDWCEKQLQAVLAATASAGLIAEPAAAPVMTFETGIGESLFESKPAPASDEPSDFSLTLTNYLKARAASNRRFHRSETGGPWRAPAMD